MTQDTELGYATQHASSKWGINEGDYEPTTGLSDAVVILAADTAYTNHAKAMLVNCRTIGEWKKDFAIVLADGTDPSPFEGRGIHIVPSTSPDGFYQKLSVFSPTFRRWKYAFYMDCDIIVQSPLQPVFDELERYPLLGHVEPFDLFHMFTYWATMETYNNAPKDIYNWLWTNFDPRYIQFNTACLPFRPASIPVDALDRLFAMQAKLHPINIHVVRGTDQPVINLAFYRQFTKIRDRLFCHWNEESPESVALHYCSGYAPWIDKQAGMDAYSNPRLKRPCYDIYCEHLSRWEEVFPRC